MHGDMTGTLVIRRDRSEAWDLLVPNVIMVNGKRAGRIWWGREARIGVPPGRAAVQLKASGVQSRIVNAQTASGTTSFFECGPRRQMESRRGRVDSQPFAITLTPGPVVVDPSALDSVAELFDLICRPLRAAEREAAWELFSAEYLGTGANLGNSLHEALANIDVVRNTGPWLLMQVDWKACDEVEWQGQAIARTLGIDDTQFRWDWKPVQAAHTALREPDLPTEVGLRHFDAYLARRAHRYLAIDDESDMFLGVVVPTEDVVTAISLAARSGHVLRLADI